MMITTPPPPAPRLVGIELNPGPPKNSDANKKPVNPHTQQPVAVSGHQEEEKKEDEVAFEDDESGDKGVHAMPQTMINKITISKICRTFGLSEEEKQKLDERNEQSGELSMDEMVCMHTTQDARMHDIHTHTALEALGCRPGVEPNVVIDVRSASASALCRDSIQRAN
jgi:hypothetical protein